MPKGMHNHNPYYMKAAYAKGQACTGGDGVHVAPVMGTALVWWNILPSAEPR